MLRAWRLLPWPMRNHSTFGRLLTNSLEIKFHLALNGLLIFYCSFSHSASCTPASLLLPGAFAQLFPLPGRLFSHIVRHRTCFIPLGFCSNVTLPKRTSLSSCLSYFWHCSSALFFFVAFTPHVNMHLFVCCLPPTTRM